MNALEKQFQKNKTIKGLVEYKSVYSAAGVLRQQVHQIGDIEIYVSIADSWLQRLTPDYDLPDIICPKKPSQKGNKRSRKPEPKLKLLDLNDDCLFEILKYFNVLDLDAVNRTSKRLHRLAQDVFRLNHSAINISWKTLDKYSNINMAGLTYHNLRNLLNSFGPAIRKLNICSISFKEINRNRLLNLITGCPSLECLNLTNIRIPAKFYEMNKSFFPKLKELSFISCMLNDSIKRVFVQCKQLETLTIKSDTELIGTSLLVSFPRLVSVSFVNNWQLQSGRLQNFFNLNRQLKKVELIKCHDDVTDDIFPIISNQLQGLESLSIKVNAFKHLGKNVMSLKNLKHLRELKFNRDKTNISSFICELAVLDKIEILHLDGGAIDDYLIDALVQCKRLNTLKFRSVPSPKKRFLTELAKNLPKLQDCHISKCKPSDAMTMDLVYFVDLAQNLKILRITDSDIQVDASFFEKMIHIFEKRDHTLTINLDKMVLDMSPGTTHVIKVQCQNPDGAITDRFISLKITGPSKEYFGGLLFI